MIFQSINSAAKEASDESVPQTAFFYKGTAYMDRLAYSSALDSDIGIFL
jgi:hypothetical protein